MMADLGSSNVYREIYDALSKFGHPRGKGMRWQVDWTGGESVTIHYGPYFDVDGLAMCLLYLIGTAQGLLNVVANLQEQVLGELDDAWLAQARELTQRAEDFIQRHLDEVAARPSLEA